MEERKMSNQNNWRYEYKMVLDNLSVHEAKQLISLHPKLFFERYPSRRVNNIYFDTYDLSNYYDALAGSSKRTKLRFRWYGNSVTTVFGNMELKQKEGVLISKTTQKLDYKFNLNDMEWGEVVQYLRHNLSGQLLKEFFHACVPIIMNSYDRYYYESLDGSCRITLDFNLKVFDQRVYNRPNYRCQTPSPFKLILEVKAGKQHGFNLKNITNLLPFRIVQNSKYVSGVAI